MIDRKTFQDAFHATVLGLSTSLNNQAAIFIFSLFASKEMVGIFSIAKRISNGAGLPVQILNVYNAPLFIKMRTGTEAFNTFIRKEMKAWSGNKVKMQIFVIQGHLTLDIMGEFSESYPSLSMFAQGFTCVRMVTR